MCFFPQSTHRVAVPPQSTYFPRDETGLVCPLSWSVHCNFTGDGKCNERGWACTLRPHQPGPILPSWLNVRQKAAVATLCTLWLPLSGVQGWGVHAHPFHNIYHYVQSCGVHGRYTLPLFLLYPCMYSVVHLPSLWGWRVRTHPLSLYLPSRTKLWRTLQPPMCALWSFPSPRDGFFVFFLSRIMEFTWNSIRRLQ